MSTKILVTGSNGQLGQSIKKLSPEFPSYQFTFTDVEELDITSVEELNKFLSANFFDAIINCAAYTAVDKAEEEPEQANRINSIAPGILAGISNETKTLLVHISTDYIFNGKKSSPYIEDDSPKPISVYAKSKADGEANIIINADKAVIIRTSWLYSEFGHNFIKTILRLAKERDSISIVDDQFGTPTYATDLAQTILKLLPKLLPINGTEIYHYSNEGSATWFDFAKEIVNQSQVNSQLIPIETKDYPLPAKRPFYSLMSKEKIKKQFQINIPDWKKSLGDCLSILND